METAAKIWEATTEEGEITITPIIEFLNNIKFLASAYNQMWVIKKMVLNGENTIAFVDDVTGDKKMILVNPDPLMQQAIDEIVARGWFSVKKNTCSIQSRTLKKRELFSLKPKMRPA